MNERSSNRRVAVLLVAVSFCACAHGAAEMRVTQNARDANSPEISMQQGQPATVAKKIDAKSITLVEPGMYEEERIIEWLEKYKRAWEKQDPELVATLFTENARYAVNPLENVLNTRQAIKAYWSAGTASAQKDIKFDHELWSATNEMAIVHWTASFTRTATEEHVNMDGVFRLGFVQGEESDLVCALLEEWWFSAAGSASKEKAELAPEKIAAVKTVKSAPFSLKTKISTPRFDETIEYYQAAFGMTLAQTWDKPDDRGAILIFNDGRDEALFEIYYSDETHDFSGLSLQFRVDDLNAFIQELPEQYEYEGPKPRPWGSTYLYLRDPNDILIIIYEGGM